MQRQRRLAHAGRADDGDHRRQLPTAAEHDRVQPAQFVVTADEADGVGRQLGRGGGRRGRSGRLVDGGLAEPVPVGAGQPERVGQQPHRERSRGGRLSAFDLPDGPDAQPDAGGQVVLRQAQPPPM
jgi:hypothetical protein